MSILSFELLKDSAPGMTKRALFGLDDGLCGIQQRVMLDKVESSHRKDVKLEKNLKKLHVKQPSIQQAMPRKK